MVHGTSDHRIPTCLLWFNFMDMEHVADSLISIITECSLYFVLFLILSNSSSFLLFVVVLRMSQDDAELF